MNPPGHNRWSLLSTLAIAMAGVIPLLFSACENGSGGSSSQRDSECEGCHGAVDGTGGIEDAHPAVAIGCVDCHGGDGEAKDMEDAHVAVPDGVDSVAQVRSMSSVELDAIDPAYVRWINPSDYRVTDETCGQADCHVEIAETAPSSIMTTFAGHFNKSRYYVGSQDTRQALRGVRAQTGDDPEGHPGAVASLEVHKAPEVDASSDIGEFLDHYLEKGCPRCHVWNFGPNDVRGDFRSSGCAGCHMVYDNSGLSQSKDPTANVDDPPHPRIHQLTTSIPDSQCEHCHYRGNRIGTMYRGLREQGRMGDPDGREVLEESLHGHPVGYYIVDEDGSNDVDETPPDLHQSAGLGCVDCHMGVDVHGDGKLYGAHDYQVGIECVDCHGTQEAAIAPNADGVFESTGGNEMKLVFEDEDGNPVMTSRLDGSTHALAQIVDLDLSASTDLGEAHGNNHLEVLECYTCHSSWTQSCFGCHVTIDMRDEGKSLIDGSLTPGRTGGARNWVTTDYLGLAMGVDGLITPMAPQEKMFITVILDCDPATETCTDGVDTPRPGKRLFDQQFRTTHDGVLGFGYGPVVPHTTSKTSQPCDRCHLREDMSNLDIFNETIGVGSGRFQIPDGDGMLHDLTRVVDDMYDPLVGFAHEGTSPLPESVIDKMEGVIVEDSGLTLQTPVPWEPH